MKTELINQVFHNSRSGLAVVEGYEKDNTTGVPELYLVNFNEDNSQLNPSHKVWNEENSKVGYFSAMDPAHQCKIVAAKIVNLHHDFNKDTISLEFDFHFC